MLSDARRAKPSIRVKENNWLVRERRTRLYALVEALLKIRILEQWSTRQKKNFYVYVYPALILNIIYMREPL